ncbi:MAG: TonB-dependent receptor, partial [Acidobacteria bacterium]|nr:TonB-dependent receptor [Acidobacteriota bacterium]
MVAAPLLVMTLILAPAGLAQTTSTGALSGVVTDPTGAIVSGVAITAANASTGEQRTVSSQDNGAYVIPQLPPGIYQIEATKSGFKRATSSSIRINVAETTTLDLSLDIGEVSETVTITSEPAVTQTESSALGRVIDDRVVSNLPLVTRNYTQILALSPGVTTDVNNAAEVGRGNSGTTSITSGGTFTHGTRQYDNNFQLNGVQINDLQGTSNNSGGVAIPNPDTIEQFKVQTGQYDAVFGRGAGANVNVVTKGGGNDFHGTLFEFFRNEALNANDFFSNRVGQEKGILRQNQFGFTLGGPIKKDKLLFFGSYQGTRQLNGVARAGGLGGTAKCAESVSSPPLTDDRSAAALGRLFAGQRGLLQNAFGGVGPAILADGSNINPVALRLLQFTRSDGSFLIPTPQVIDTTKPFDLQGFSAFSQPCTFSEDQFMVNADFLQTSKSKFSGRTFFATSDLNNTFVPGAIVANNVPGFPNRFNNRYTNISLAHSYVFGSSLFNEARFGYTGVRVKSQQGGVFKWSDVGVPAVEQANDLPNISIIGSFQIGGASPINYDQKAINFDDTLSYIVGRHTLRLGGGITRSAVDSSNFRFNSALIFLSFPDFLLGLNGPGNGTGLFSNVFGAIDFIGLTERKLRVVDGNLFAQDDFKVSPRLTLNLGLRYNRIGHFTDQLGRNANFDPARANPNPPATGSLAGYVVPQNFTGQPPAGVEQLDNEFGNKGEGQNNLAPRLGFAWQILPKSSRFVLRGGYGIYYSRSTGQPFFQLQAGPPFGNLRVSTGAANAGATFQNPFPQPIPSESSLPTFVPYSPTTRLSATAIAQDYRPSRTQQYSLNLQTELAPNLLLEVGYVGTRGDHLIRTRSINQAQLASTTNPIRGVTTNTLANVPQRVPIQGFSASNFSVVESAGMARYNGLEVSLTKRFSQGLQLLTSYTFSKSLDTDGANTQTASSGGNTTGNQNDPQ